MSPSRWSARAAAGLAACTTRRRGRSVRPMRVAAREHPRFRTRRGIPSIESGTHRSPSAKRRTRRRRSPRPTALPHRRRARSRRRDSARSDRASTSQRSTRGGRGWRRGPPTEHVPSDPDAPRYNSSNQPVASPRSIDCCARRRISSRLDIVPRSLRGGARTRCYHGARFAPDPKERGQSGAERQRLRSVERDAQSTWCTRDAPGQEAPGRSRAAKIIGSTPARLVSRRRESRPSSVIGRTFVMLLQCTERKPPKRLWRGSRDYRPRTPPLLPRRLGLGVPAPPPPALAPPDPDDVGLLLLLPAATSASAAARARAATARPTLRVRLRARPLVRLARADLRDPLACATPRVTPSASRRSRSPAPSRAGAACRWRARCARGRSLRPARRR